MQAKIVRGDADGHLLTCVLLTTILFSGCSSGGGGGGGGGGTPGEEEEEEEEDPPGGGGPTFGEEGGSAAPPLSDGQTVTWLETHNPWMDSYILRGTIPVAPGTFPRDDGLQPFTIYDYDGTPLETQTNPVTRYPNSTDGADVVEVMARVRTDPAIGRGQYNSYEVRQSPRNAPPSSGLADIGDLRRVLNLTPNVESLLDDPQSVELAAYDCFGNKYVAYPLDGTGEVKFMRYGLVQTELRIYQNMEPESPDPGPQGTLPHFFGVHSYVSTVRGDDLVFFDVRFHNGHSGNDDNDPSDNPLDKVYFERIDITVPDNWFVQQGFDDPLFGDESFANDRRTVSIVNPNSDGTLHTMRWQGQMHRRLVLSTSGLNGEAKQYVEAGAGQGFCTRGVDPDDGHEYWSWWNRGTARYFPQNYQLPRLDHVGLSNLRDSERSKWNSLKGHLLDGTGNGNYPIQVGNLGWAHPYGVSYGGMTGGSEIFLYDGVKTAQAASRYGTQVYKMYHRMHTDRQPIALYDADGLPSSVEDWVVNGQYVPFEFFVLPNLSGGVDPFGLGDAQQFQINHVQGSSLQPTYESDLRNFDPHDYQHYVRYTRSPKVLLWLANDSIAKDDLRMAAEVFHLAYHTYDNSQWGNLQGTGMKEDQEHIATYPQTGFQVGRGEAWGIDSVLAAYAAADDDFRAEKISWFRDLATMFNDGQGACNGVLQSNITPKNLGALYRTRQMIEQSILENMLQGLRETAFRNHDNAFSDLTRDVLIDSLNLFKSDMVFVGGTVPAQITAIGPLDLNLPLWCTFAEMQAANSPGAETWYGNDGYQNWCSYAWGYELTGDQEFLDRAQAQLGAGTLFNTLMADGTNNIENRSAVLALAQRLQGQL